MKRDALNAICASFPHSDHVIQWGNSDVWKVGGKVFAVIGWNGDEPAITFKVTPLAYEVLSDQPGIRPAPYLASRGMKWVQVFEDRAMSDDSLTDHVKASYDMIVAGLTKAKRKELGLLKE